MTCPECGEEIEVSTQVWVFFKTGADGSILWEQREVEWDTLDYDNFEAVCAGCGKAFPIRDEKVVTEGEE